MNFAALEVRRVRGSGEDWYKLSDAPKDGQVRWVRASTVEVLRGPYVAVVPAGVEEGAHPTETHSPRWRWCIDNQSARAGDRFDVVVPDLEHGDPHPVRFPPGNQHSCCKLNTMHLAPSHTVSMRQVSTHDFRWSVSTVACLFGVAIFEAMEWEREVWPLAILATWGGGYMVGKFLLNSTDTRVSC